MAFFFLLGQQKRTPPKGRPCRPCSALTREYGMDDLSAPSHELVHVVHTPMTGEQR
jgi:hypothetical protein